MNCEIKIGDLFAFHYLSTDNEPKPIVELFYVCSDDPNLDYMYGTLINGGSKRVWKNFTWRRTALIDMVRRGDMIHHKRKNI